MPNLVDILREQTHKEEGLEIEQRVFYTLYEGKNQNLQNHRNSKAIAELIKILSEKGVLGEEDVDNILLRAVDY
jgi:hypothetical protein